MLLWLAVVWGLVQSLKIRLLAMLHVGFVWLGLALLYSAASQALWLATGQPVLGLGALHALSMGFLGSIMVAMVTRVSLDYGIPIANAILTTEDLEQAIARQTEKGRDAAYVAVEMAQLLNDLV